MKSKKLKLYPILLFLMFICLVLFGTGSNDEITETEPDEEVCDYETTETDPAKLIIGKWELLKEDNKPIVKSNPDDVLYWIFESDSLFIWQYTKDGVTNTTNRKYWVDSLLHYNIDSGFALTPWHYEFTDNCTFKVGSAFLIDPSPINWIFKRIKP